MKDLITVFKLRDSTPKADFLGESRKVSEEETLDLRDGSIHSTINY